MGYSPLNNSSISPLEFTISELEYFVDLNLSYLTFDIRLPTNNAGLYADGQVTEAEARRLYQVRLPGQQRGAHHDPAI